MSRAPAPPATVADGGGAMNHRRRALLLIALALLLGLLAASSVQRREAALDAALGPPARVLVTAAPVVAGAPLADARPALRELPRRYVPPDALTDPRLLAGAQAAVALPAGAYVTRAVLRTPGAAAVPVGPGERAAEVVARGDPATIVAGSRVDVLVTRDATGERPGTTVLALEDVEVLDAGPPAPGEEAAAGGGDGDRVAASLRVTVRQAVYLAAAQSFARELRLLPRAPDDRRRGRAGLAIDERLR
ncbi:RcpC/CpaB family pilus assembly protein [Conexibacter sp. CPCC 206217]|uniref:RcpC/CpaB family pilus assembly protein n=1 Tax=Conexibacter sp. CPCC 206217 TaxID=3064574 RepID=UPI00271ADE2A|nr:RcpC/CpaB family pilus assembly protein [Conexibacter sp. CPCC 206217]MDO8212693.1 RcpC/CpaB family pilus assembly protein [Conexibacter sp. CPCC 206217]